MRLQYRLSLTTQEQARPVAPPSATQAFHVRLSSAVLPPQPARAPDTPPPDVPVMQVLFGLMLAILLGALEQSIVAVVLPDIALQLNGFEDSWPG